MVVRKNTDPLRKSNTGHNSINVACENIVK